MTFEERLDRIAERHEALAQSVELLSADLRALGEKIDRMAENTKANEKLWAENWARNQDRLLQHENLIGQLAEGTARLLHVAEIHENRLERLEGGELG